MYKIYLIRHGKTVANESGLYCGHTDLPLSEQGREEILRLKVRGIYPEAGIYFTSGLTRTAQTLELIYGGVEYVDVPDIKEFHFGRFEMKSYEELRELGDYQSWITDTSDEVRCPGGESKKEFHERVWRGYERIVRTVHDRGVPAAVVCHGGVIVSIMDGLFPGRKNFYEWQPSAGKGYGILEDTGRNITYSSIGGTE